MGMLDKLMQKMGLDDEDEFEDEKEFETNLREETNVEPMVTNIPNRNPKVVSFHKNMQPIKMVVVQPTNLEDAKEICDYLKDNKPVVVNIDVDALHNEMPQRILDFLSGCVYALEGSIETVTRGIYVVAPSNVDITNQISQIK